MTYMVHFHRTLSFVGLWSTQLSGSIRFDAYTRRVYGYIALRVRVYSGYVPFDPYPYPRGYYPYPCGYTRTRGMPYFHPLKSH